MAKLIVERELVKRLPKSAETPAKAEVADEGVEVISYNNIKDFPLEQDSSVDQLTFEDIKFEARQLALGGHWDEAFNTIDSYKGPEKEAVAQLRHEIERAKVKFEEIQNNISATKNTGDLNTSEAVKERKEAERKREIELAENNKPKKLQPLMKPRADTSRGPNGFLYETDLDRRQARGGQPPVSLVVHSKQVGLPQNVIVVWKDRSLVLSYSRLIKKLENRESRFYKQRVNDAKEFLAEHKNRYALIPYAKAKMSLRRVGFTVSEVFFNETVKDEYNHSETSRYKGFIISYDLKQTAVRRGGGFSMGC